MIFLSKFVMCMQNNEQHISDWWLCLFPCIENCMTGSKKWCEGWNYVPHPVHRLGNVPVNFIGHNYAFLPNLSVKLPKQILQICCSQPDALSCACSNQRHRSMSRKNATYVQNRFVDSQSSTHAWGWCQQKICKHSQINPTVWMRFRFSCTCPMMDWVIRMSESSETTSTQLIVETNLTHNYIHVGGTCDAWAWLRWTPPVPILAQGWGFNRPPDHALKMG